MKIAIFGDVHGNLPALEIFFSKTKEMDFSINLGDTVNYGPWSNECAELLFNAKNNINILGNHDQAFLNRVYTGKNEIARSFFNHCIEDFNTPQYLQQYSNTVFLNNTCFSHTINDEYIYADSPVELSCQTVIGHSHRQFILNSGEHRLINPGSIGQNRINISVINYATWDTGTNHFELCSIPYDVNIVIAEMKHRKYPQQCIDYYLSKMKNAQ